ncbi:hypothetical protein [Micromonospora sp. BL4]|nr:hypothetical protein [Micromonospora sp. BL4]
MLFDVIAPFPTSSEAILLALRDLDAPVPGRSALLSLVGERAG